MRYCLKLEMFLCLVKAKTFTDNTKRNCNFQEKAKKVTDSSLHNNGIKPFMKSSFAFQNIFWLFNMSKTETLSENLEINSYYQLSERFCPYCVVQQYDGCKSLYCFWPTLLRPQLWS